MRNPLCYRKRRSGTGRHHQNQIHPYRVRRKNDTYIKKGTHRTVIHDSNDHHHRRYLRISYQYAACHLCVHDFHSTHLLLRSIMHHIRHIVCHHQTLKIHHDSDCVRHHLMCRNHLPLVNHIRRHVTYTNQAEH